MSTRRARIKAVASLPVRRKNVNSNEAKKIKQTTPKNSPRHEITASLHSIVPEQPQETVPSTTHNALVNITEDNNLPIFLENNLSTLNSVSSTKNTNSTPSHIETALINNVGEVILNMPGINNDVEKVPVITPSPLYKNSNNLALLSPKSSNFSPVKLSYLNPQKPTNESSNKPQSKRIRYESDSDADGSNNIQHKSITKLVSHQKEAENDCDIYGISQLPIIVDEDAVFDGIVPLQSVPQVPKPLHLLKNEMISDNVEVLFDPIVPLPSPSKVRAKLRPVPRLGPLRRNSIQGSASESEDENRRMLLGSNTVTPVPSRQRHDSQSSVSTQNTLPNREVSRVRNDSVSSVLSQTTNQPLVPPSPYKDKHLLTKAKRLENSRRFSALRRKQRARECIPKDGLTMYDLIFYNPTTNPIVHDKQEVVNINKNEIKEAEPTPEPEESVDDPPAPPVEDSNPVPQIKIGPDGKIILDEQSLVIEQTKSDRKLSQTVVHEKEWANSGKGIYKRDARTADWSDVETIRFYRALAAVGTDFSMMMSLFPKRTRKDLKLKFKKEERVNSSQVDKALRSQVHWDLQQLEEEFKNERINEIEKAERQRRKLEELRRKERAQLRGARNNGAKISKSSKALNILTSAVNNNDGITAEEMYEEAKRSNTTKAKLVKPPKHPNLPKADVKLISKNIRNATQIIYPKLTPMATLTPSGNSHANQLLTVKNPDMATVTKLNELTGSTSINPGVAMPTNAEKGSLVVLTVNDPNSPAKKMLQTYISDGNGHLTPIALPPSFLNAVVGYMKKGTPKSIAGSPNFLSPTSVTSEGSNSTPSSKQVNPLQPKR